MVKSDELIVLIVADVAYAIIGIWIAWFIYKLPPSYASDPIRKHRKAFYIGALGLCIARTMWCTSIAAEHRGVFPLLMNRFAFSLYLTCFSAVLFTWIHFLNMDYHVYFVKNERYLNFVKLFLIGFNILLYIGAIVSAVIYSYYGSDYSRREMFFFAVATFLIGFMLLISGIRVYCMTRGAATVRTVQLLLFISTLFGLMLMRVIMMLYHQTTGKYLNNILYNCLSYFVPELVSVFVKMLVFSTAPEPKDTTTSLAVVDLESEIDTNHVAMYTRFPDRKSGGNAFDGFSSGHEYRYLNEDIPGLGGGIDSAQLSFSQIDPMSGISSEEMAMPDLSGSMDSVAPHLLALESQYKQQFTPLTAAAAAAAAAAAGYVPPTILGVQYNHQEALFEYTSPNAGAAAAATSLTSDADGPLDISQLTMTMGVPGSEQYYA